MIRFFSKTNMPKILSQKEKKFKNVEFLQYNHLEKFFFVSSNNFDHSADFFQNVVQQLVRAPDDDANDAKEADHDIFGDYHFDLIGTSLTILLCLL